MNKNTSLVGFDLHPSNFQNNAINNVNLNMQNQKTLIDLTNERTLSTNANSVRNPRTLNVFGLEPSSSIKSLKSPGTYQFTTNDNTLSGSNTRYMFRNLYGETPLTFLFFSKDNINNLQDIIKMLVYKQMNYVIDKQSVTDLEIIMRSIFLAYSEHPELLDEKMPDAKKNAILKLYKNEVARLNELVINDIVPRVCSQLQAYLDYLRDASGGLRTIPRSENTSVAGTRTYRSITSALGLPL